MKFLCINSVLRRAGRLDVLRRGLSCTVQLGAEKTGTPTDIKNNVVIKGHVNYKKPVKVTLEAGKLYSWCVCGASKKQPFCDNSHRELNEKNPDKTAPQFRSHKFQVDEKKDYMLCMCKQTDNRPFCDGTHKKKEIQDAVIM